MFETPDRSAPVAASPAAASPLPADPDGLLDVIEFCEREVARLHAVQLRAMAALEAARRGTRLAEFVPDEVSLAIRISPNAARDRMWVAQQLSTRLPATLAALESGGLDYYRARCVVEATARLPDQDQVAAVEARVLPRAPEQSAPQLRAALRRAVLAADPAGGEARHHRARAQRRVERRPDEDGMACLWVYGPADGITALYTALDGVARTKLRDPEEARTLGHLRTDTLLELGRAICDAGGLAGIPLAGRRRARPHLHVTVGADTLLGVSDEPGWLAGYGPIPASMARRIAQDATWRRILTDPPTGSLLDYAADTHDPGVVLAGHVIARDQDCRFPTCTVPAEYCDLDHTIAHPDGPTTAGNLGPPAGVTTAPNKPGSTSTNTTPASSPGPPPPAANTKSAHPHSPHHIKRLRPPRAA